MIRAGAQRRAAWPVFRTVLDVGRVNAQPALERAPEVSAGRDPDITRVIAEGRAQLDKFFKMRAEQGGYLQPDQYFGVQSVVSDMSDVLKSKITSLDTRDYLLARGVEDLR